MNMNKQTTYLKGLISAYNFYNGSENKEYILLKKKTGRPKSDSPNTDEANNKIGKCEVSSFTKGKNTNTILNENCEVSSEKRKGSIKEDNIIKKEEIKEVNNINTRKS